MDVMEKFFLEEAIVWVHDDLEPWASLNVGFNENKDFVVELTFEGMEGNSSQQHYRKQIIIDRSGIDNLVDRLHTPLMKLPKTFAKKFEYDSGEECRFECWDIKVVFDIYYDILNYLSMLNVYYKIETYYI